MRWTATCRLCHPRHEAGRQGLHTTLGLVLSRAAVLVLELVLAQVLAVQEVVLGARRGSTLRARRLGQWAARRLLLTLLLGLL